jgi:hypothetical protein
MTKNDNTSASRGNVIPFPVRPRNPTAPCSLYQATLDLWTGQSAGFDDLNRAAALEYEHRLALVERER